MPGNLVVVGSGIQLGRQISKRTIFENRGSGHRFADAPYGATQKACAEGMTRAWAGHHRRSLPLC
jgi:hypothetical protein